jgi:predicted RNase H-related nuclease YkuK (DUF458 family)
MKKSINLHEVREYLKTQTADTKIYIGADSERVCLNKDTWVVDYTLAIVVHIDSKHGCKVFGEVHREKDYGYDTINKPRMRLMNEVYKLAELYLKIGDVLDGLDVEVHLDINPNEKYGSSCVINEAVGFIKGVCQVTPKVKPEAWAASTCADRVKEVLEYQKFIAAAV